MPTFITDNRVLWLKIPKKGSPQPWEPNKNYRLGDIVVPTSTVTIPAGEEDNMFQCVGFVGTAGPSSPTWPTSTNITVEDNQVEWAARDPSQDPAEPGPTEYYWIKRNITVSS